MLDTLLENHPELVKMCKDDIMGGNKNSGRGRGDSPTVEQVVRAAVFKELKDMNYRDLEYAQSDSRICATFLKLDERKRPISFQVWQEYISRVTEETLNGLLVRINQIAIDEGLEDMKRLRMDSTVVETDIHYPTNNALVWDCIKESYRLLDHLARENTGLTWRDYRKGGKKTHFRINNTKSKDKRAELFRKQLATFTKVINEVDEVVRTGKKKACSLEAFAIIEALKRHQGRMYQVRDITYRGEVLGEKVPNEEKVFSIYEPHTDIIVKGHRDVEFGHKVHLATGRSNLIMDCEVIEGNPSDSALCKDGLERITSMYERTPRDVSLDGGYASLENQRHAREQGIVNVVYGKVKGSLQNIVSSQNMETRLKRWRSGIEAVISNFKRGFDMRVCEWKGRANFGAKVLWSAIAYNIRVMTRIILGRLSTA